MAANWKDVLENAIIGAAVTALVDEGHIVEARDAGEGFMLLAVDPKPHGAASSWVKFRLGNGATVINDYTTDLEAALKPAIELSEQFET